MLPVRVPRPSSFAGLCLLCALLLAPPLAAMQSGPASTTSVPDTLAQRIKACTSCHGDKGQGGDNGYYPRLAGKPALYLYRQLLNFQAGMRLNPMMQHMVHGLSDDYLYEIAAHFAALQPPQRAPEQGDWSAALLARGSQLVRHGDASRKLPACQACHGKRLTGVEPAIPALLGLPSDYISAQLGAWRAGTRSAPTPDCMAEVAQRLSEQDTRAVAAWLASQKLPEPATPMPRGSVDPPLECGSLQQ